MEVITKSALETKKLGKELANSLIKKFSNPYFTISLTGDLGCGKTTFVQGFAEFFGIKGRIISPTFVLIRTYSIPRKFKPFSNLYHVDLYRLSGNLDEEVKNIGLLDILGRNGNIALIEWGEKIKNILPSNSLWVEFENLGANLRRIKIK